MPTYTVGIDQPYDSVNAGVIPKDVYPVSINYYLNRAPLYSRLPHLPVGSASFLCTNDNYRPRNDLVTVANADDSTATLTVADTSRYAEGDVVEVESETMLVTAITSSTVLAVTRGYQGTSGATHAIGKAIYLVGNTRRGNEIDVSANNRIPLPTEQYVQNIQHAYQVGGGLQSKTNYVSGLGSPLDRGRMLAMQNCIDDFEGTAYYGKGLAMASNGRPQMKGLRTLIATNNANAPSGYAAYKQSDFIRDTFQKVLDAGGNPTAMLLSTDFMQGLSIWGAPLTRLETGANELGISPDRYQVPFLSGVSLIPAPLLRPGTAVCLSGAEARVRLARALFDKPRGSRGDASEGDLIMEGAIEVDNEAHHAWVDGITGFAAG